MPALFADHDSFTSSFLVPIIAIPKSMPMDHYPQAKQKEIEMVVRRLVLTYGCEQAPYFLFFIYSGNVTS